ncbi:transcriptional regulator [Rhizobium leguminosarum]|uniref:type IV toxin-antitoxin system AbiEi family antitoxin domain-containing protein n=1 Tax=Rhizobium ruizarguesonis TaxID=2081791 RepID=UPI0013BCC9A4|nr:transcriptional regulator [Rhizobium ruizarguesonis]MBY5871798.1 transcriptional regulator [Rhizobium leguminosarum]NEH63413.1 transcriptional regulator [Rhizobium ruizarguesonis]NEI20881.1 transcriptional regulator [Rhizobium ruizarguesonis]
MMKNMKTLGRSTASLLTALHDERRTIFSLDDAVRILGGTKKAVSNLLSKAQQRGVVTRLRRGTYILVPFELGSESVYAGDPWVVADRLFEDKQRYLSHGTAMAIHGMTQLFGIGRKWFEHGYVMVSDVERTIVDCLRRPDLCGGFSEIAAGTWMVKEKVKTKKLVDYALQIKTKAVVNRTGFLMASCDLGDEEDMQRLRSALTDTYHLLDPTMPDDGRFNSRWRLRVNVSEEQTRVARAS